MAKRSAKTPKPRKSGEVTNPRKPNTFKGCGRKLSTADFDEAERLLGFSLPASLRAVYASCNGGRPTRPIFMDSDGNDYEVKEFARIKYKISYEPLMTETYEALAKQRGIIPKRLLPFASDSGGDLYCIDINTETIWFWAADDHKKGKPESAASQVAPSLQAFIDGMVTERDAYG